MTGNHTESAILRDLRQKTGLVFRQLPQINPYDAKTIVRVLTVLREWVPFVKEPNIKASIYYIFATPYADPFFSEVLTWWHQDSNSDGASYLTHAVTLLTNTEERATEVWELWKKLDPKPRYSYETVAGLAKFRAVAAETNEEIVRALREKELSIRELQAVANVDDPRIRSWFQEQLEANDVAVRKLARRVTARKSKLPAAVQFASSEPDKRTRELFSTEVDVGDLKGILALIKKKFGVTAPRGLAAGGFLNTVPVNRWLFAEAESAGEERHVLWFRLEDIDVVEVVLTKEEPRPLTNPVRPN